jgi:hypothetical protein
MLKESRGIRDFAQSFTHIRIFALVGCASWTARSIMRMGPSPYRIDQYPNSALGGEVEMLTRPTAPLIERASQPQSWNLSITVVLPLPAAPTG